MKCAKTKTTKTIFYIIFGELKFRQAESPPEQEKNNRVFDMRVYLVLDSKAI